MDGSQTSTSSAGAGSGTGNRWPRPNPVAGARTVGRSRDSPQAANADEQPKERPKPPTGVSLFSQCSRADDPIQLSMWTLGTAIPLRRARLRSSLSRHRRPPRSFPQEASLLPLRTMWPLEEMHRAGGPEVLPKAGAGFQAGTGTGDGNRAGAATAQPTSA